MYFVLSLIYYLPHNFNMQNVLHIFINFIHYDHMCIYIYIYCYYSNKLCLVVVIYMSSGNSLEMRWSRLIRIDSVGCTRLGNIVASTLQGSKTLEIDPWAFHGMTKHRSSPPNVCSVSMLVFTSSNRLVLTTWRLLLQ